MMGDNCFDVYERLGRAYPTGNVVDTGVNLRKLGVEVSILSATGSDFRGQMMRETLGKLDLDLSHLKVLEGKTAVTYMDMEDNDRIHGEYDEGVLGKMQFDLEDQRFALDHDLIHSALWGKADQALCEIRKQSSIPISFDFADRLDHPLVEAMEGIVDYGFFSYKGQRDSWIEAFLKQRVEKGMRQAIATFGKSGSLVYDGEHYHEFGIFPAKVVNTVGAGDSYIAGYLYGLLQNWPIHECQKLGAKVAAQVVAVFEPWGEGELYR
ncbi:fructoselysine 6-kinase [Proteiniclasticum sediminis]|nr:fructoselysine 6-kinase [Proteiniclasticum sediminis]